MDFFGELKPAVFIIQSDDMKLEMKGKLKKPKVKNNKEKQSLNICLQDSSPSTDTNILKYEILRLCCLIRKEEYCYVDPACN